MKKILALALALLTIVAAFAIPTTAADTDVVTKGLVIHYDGVNNAGNAHDSKSVLWKDATGNKNDFGLDLDAANYWKDNALHVDGAFFYLTARLGLLRSHSVRLSSSVPATIPSFSRITTTSRSSVVPTTTASSSRATTQRLSAL